MNKLKIEVKENGNFLNYIVKYGELNYGKTCYYG